MLRFRRSRTATVLLLILSCAMLLAGCANDTENNTPPADQQTTEPITIKVGASANPHAEILEFVKPGLLEQGINLDIVLFNDYVQPNLATDSGEIDLNYFQHLPYLESFCAERNLNLVSLGGIHIEPMGIYSKTATDLAGLADGAVLTIPNDPTNGGRALLLLQKAGLITLKEDAGLEATPIDIADNPHNYTITAMDAPQLPRSLDDSTVTASVINSNFALEAGLNPVSDSIYIEDVDSPYANILAAKAERAEDANLLAVLQALQTPEAKAFIEETYSGAVVPAF